MTEIQIVNVFIAPLNLGLRPIRQVLPLEQNSQAGRDGCERQSPQHGRNGGTGDGETKPYSVGPGAAQGSQEILHKLSCGSCRNARASNPPGAAAATKLS